MDVITWKNYKDISEVEWRVSRNKWIKILKRVKNKTHFSNQDGWRNFRVASECGYCFAYGSLGFSHCRYCPLTYLSVCHSFSNGSVFWHFMYTMRILRDTIWGPGYNTPNEPPYSLKRKKELWFEAEVLAGIILESIEDHGRSLGYLNKE